MKLVKKIMDGFLSVHKRIVKLVGVVKAKYPIWLLHMHNSRDFAIRQAPAWHSVLKICIPAVILMLAMAIYNVIDKYLALTFSSNDILNHPEYQQAIADYLKEHPLLHGDRMGAVKQMINLATNFASQIYVLLLSFATLFGIGTAITFSIRFGAQHRNQMSKVVANGFIASFVGSLFIGVIGVLLILPSLNYPLLNAQSNIGNKHTAAIVSALNDMSFNYALLMAACTPIMFLNYLTISLIRSEGRMIYITTVVIISIFVNVLFAYILMDIAHMMLLGAMLATVIAWIFSFVMCMYIILFDRHTYLRFTAKGFRVDFKIIHEIVILGLSALISNIAVAIVSIIATILSGLLPSTSYYKNDNGELQLLYSALSPWMLLTVAPAFGIFQGGTTLVGYAYGANRYDRCRKLTMRMMIMQVIWFCFVLIIFIAIGDKLLSAFNDNYEPQHRWLLVLNFTGYPFAFVTFSAITFLQSIGKGRTSTVAIAMRSVIMPVPLMFIGYGVSLATGNPIWFYVFFGFVDFLAAIAVIVIFYYATRNYHGKLHDMNLHQAVNTFETLAEVDLKVKIVSLKHKKHPNFAKIKKCKFRLMEIEQEKAEFINRVMAPKVSK